MFRRAISQRASDIHIEPKRNKSLLRMRIDGILQVFYHFVIGNGTDSQDGEIEVGWRWRRQIEVERSGDIQICLVGDFNRQPFYIYLEIYGSASSQKKENKSPKGKKKK